MGWVTSAENSIPIGATLIKKKPKANEADVYKRQVGGIEGQRALWKLVESDRLVLADLSPALVDRSARLMDQYSGRPMDLADATLVALAEERGDRRIFTLDADFQIYRLRGRQHFELLPSP